MQMDNNPEVIEEMNGAAPELQQPQELEAAETPAPENEEKPQEQKGKKSVGKEILSWVLTLGAAVLIALCIRAFLFEPVRVDGNSMLDTLRDGEIMLVTKPEYIFSDPQRGDVVICTFPGARNEGKNFVKRIVAIPGDVLEFRESVLYINGEAVTEDYLTPARNIGRYNMEPMTLGEDEYFVCGDNRINSHDCRTLITNTPQPITRKDIKGHVQLVVFPFAEFRSID